ncbi:MAG: hypothetical protein MZV64_11495 [Ignavibacteriales bacterium]|nr:hypothetical protein [Ignavibacteriales bacterium]MCK7518293.1 hypothetical protein [Ignavibacteriales bacterium]
MPIGDAEIVPQLGVVIDDGQPLLEDVDRRVILARVGQEDPEGRQDLEARRIGPVSLLETVHSFLPLALFLIDRRQVGVSQVEILPPGDDLAEERDRFLQSSFAVEAHGRLELALERQKDLQVVVPCECLSGRRGDRARDITQAPEPLLGGPVELFCRGLGRKRSKRGDRLLEAFGISGEVRRLGQVSKLPEVIADVVELRDGRVEIFMTAADDPP